MAIAIVDYSVLETFVKSVNFPYDHRMNLVKGGIGFDMFDQFIREKVRWIQELEFKRDEHIKIWTSSTIVGGVVPKAHEYHSRSVLVGTENTNPFKMEGSVCHPNFVGTIHSLYQNYIADYKMSADEKVDVQEYIRVMVGKTAADSSLGYGLEVPVETIWNKHYKTDGEARFWLERSAYNPEGVTFEDVEYFYVRELEAAEVPQHFEFNEMLQKYVRIKAKETTTVRDVEFKSAEALDLNNFSEDEDVYIAQQRGFEDNVDMLKLGHQAS